MRTAIGTFPIRLKALPGEALDSWLEAFAHRLHTPLGDVLNDLGLLVLEDGLVPGSSSTEMLTRCLSPVIAASIAQATGTPVAALHAKTLAHYDQRVLDLDPRSGLPQSATRWGKSTGSRFCTDCLAESGGRWQLGWSFACVRHNRLLADHCPQCRSRQRTRALATREIPHPGHCPNASSADDTGPGRRRCDADLAQASTLLLDADHPVLDAQRLVYAMTDSGTAAFGAYADHPHSEPSLTCERSSGRSSSTLPANPWPNAFPRTSPSIPMS
ncbi:TniQ family protein [Streptomyces sp. GC420]|uniref:TniQ family protein n=1 Tax=Streptomyces sp. GC420 TaxID=2697568 RepID=UPI001414E995|nr:TniQ family protein [Streptomyces sp. GC420]NBM17326.1 hypothetical protein [Streptomyces sp. GC420]